MPSWKDKLNGYPVPWLLERTYKELGKIQEKKGQPSKWVTLRALRVLKAAYPEKG